MAEKEAKDAELMKGLESMYLRVSAGEKAEKKTSLPEDLELQYAVLGLSPQSTLEEVRWTYSGLMQEWNPDRFSFEPVKKKQAEERRKEIRQAYEKICAAHGHPVENDPDHSLGENATPAPVAKTSDRSPQRRILFSLLAFLGILILGAALWSTLYYYDTFQSDGNVYPLRINRFTGSIAFFDGAKWSPPPLPVGPFLRKSTGEAPSGGRPEGEPTLTAPPQTPPALTEPPASTPSSSAPAEGLGSQPTLQVDLQKSAQPQVAEKPRPRAKKPAGDSIGEKVFTGTTGVYAIQIGLMIEPRGAQELVDSARRKGFQAYHVRDHIEDGRQGYRVLVGAFASSKEAARYMRASQIKNIYIDSFVQRIPPGSAPGKEGS